MPGAGCRWGAAGSKGLPEWVALEQKLKNVGVCQVGQECQDQRQSSENCSDSYIHEPPAKSQPL